MFIKIAIKRQINLFKNKPEMHKYATKQKKKRNKIYKLIKIIIYLNNRFKNKNNYIVLNY